MNIKINFKNTQEAEEFLSLLWHYYSFFEDLDSAHNLNADSPLNILHDVYLQFKAQVNEEVTEHPTMFANYVLNTKKYFSTTYES